MYNTPNQLWQTGGRVSTDDVPGGVAREWRCAVTRGWMVPSSSCCPTDQATALIPCVTPGNTSNGGQATHSALLS